MKRFFKSTLCVILSVIMLGSLLTPAVLAVTDDPLNGRYEKAEAKSKNAPQEEAEYSHNEKFLTGYTIADVIDVSSHNGNINWSAVAASGIKYAIIRAGWRGYGSEGSVNTDSKFHENIRAAINAGIEVGVYFYTQATNTAEAVAEADYTLALISGYDIKLPVAYDCEFAESGGGYTGRFYDANLNPYQIASLCNAFCERIESAGYKAMIYANPYMLTSKISVPSLGSYPIWLASFSSSAKYSGDYIMWQYTGKGSAEGISGNVDRSFYYIKEGEKPESFRVHSSKSNIYIGETASLTAFYDRDFYLSLGCKVSEVSWTSSNTEVITVDEKGTASGVAAGESVITGKVVISVPDPEAPGTYVDMELSKDLKLTVSEKPPEPDPQISDAGSIIEMLLNFFMMFAQWIAKLISSFASSAG